ncbi:hypothetical protein SAMN05428949_6493 [Chitinophaga sp. YR627]|uniref:hypothetical protein n=1 Tax=Chitinophaga sp. YR627 TaxID=1881041 RepID=UPI0008EE46FA|nr:hypothetical protein [Chitinophaga sp. YR627]SFO75530.1 hypothetical protein SAMN05428949_6493 [Chitinophaga sp. YR627]
MKYLFLPIILFVNIFSVQAQRLAYERADHYTKVLSSYQMDGNNITYTIRGSKYEFSYPETSFKIAFYNQLATHAVYAKYGGREVLFLTDSINMAKVKGVTRHEMSDEVIIVRIHLERGASSIIRDIEDGKVVSSIKIEHVDVYFKNGSTLGGFISTLYRLCFEMKVAQGTITQAEVDAQNHDWGMTPEKFIKKYPNSIFNMEAEQIIEKRAKAQGE